MDNLRAVIKNLFCYIAPKEILKENVTYDNIGEDTFMKLGTGYIQRYTNDEIRNMYYYLESEFQWQNCKIRETLPQKQEKEHLNVFDALTTFNYSVMIEENGEPLCQYQHLLRWRDMITIIEEDIFNTSFLAMQDILSGKNRYYFFWKPVIGHNNYALNKLVSRGVAENHFHLKGSAPQFHLSWLSIMNDVNNENFENVFIEYDRNKMQKNINYDVNYGQDSLVVMWRQAALIRVFLFALLRWESIEFDHINITYAALLKNCNKQEQEDIKADCANDNLFYEDQVDAKKYFEKIGKDSIYRIKLAYAKTKLKEMLENYELLNENLGWLQRNINRIKWLQGKSKYDYTICESWLVKNPDRGLNEVISGERWFMYAMFTKVYKKEEEWQPFINWFYLYLVLKTNIRMELVQANKAVGFDNFQRYQNRKEQLIENTDYESIYVKMAVKDTIWNQHITSLEARVAPKNSEEELEKAIKKYDKWICDGLNEADAEELRKRYFYVIHFVKESEKIGSESYRHYDKRKQVEQQAKAIAAIREEGLPASERIRGIDACSAEIGCRPEVFAHAFRYLKSHAPSQRFRDGLIRENLIESKNIMATYHAGEDFLDILDGLRAIDEAIIFLNFKCGDRLGHALALGIDIDEWYQSKSNRILINKQDYLDNLVWLYAKIRKYNLTGCEDSQIYIEKRFSEYFNDIYLNNITSDQIKDINAEAKKYFDKQNVVHGYCHDNLNFEINEYYDSWKLRGDDPELYAEGYFKAKKQHLEDWDYYAVNHLYPQNYRIRYNPETAILYYMYHYNKEVIKAGKQMVEIKVKPCIIEAVKKVRTIMQQEIARIGIGIETNPSSNYFIGTFRRYDKHPVISWYNLGLTHDNALLKECPQMQVSINTDDQGVFATYIENEYAYLALALEKSKNEDGEYTYNRTEILQWLENIRRMGQDQSFGDNLSE